MQHLLFRKIFVSKTHFERSLIEQPPQRAFLIWVIFQLFLIGADANVLNAVELYWLSNRTFNLKKNDPLAFYFDLMKPELQLWSQLLQQPVFKLFVAFPGAARVNGSPNDLVSFVVDTPNQIGVRFTNKYGSVCEGGDILTQIFGLVIIPLKLYPFSFLREFA